MSDSVILVDNLSKRYFVGHQRESIMTFREQMVLAGRNFARKTDDLLHGRMIVQGDELEEFWALKDVGFEVMKGEAIGIIGGNGAGKSTLLKILSRITEPTEGRVQLRGRVASLLEVGTGFHPELTGRENIFLNGALLGMTRQEIRNKFDEIVAFADVEQFLDTPVKRYSSGMYVRLAFAVAAHLEPEILIVDEVLAVGDAAFQRKSLTKLGEVAREKTVLFVSHNMNAIRALTTKCIFLHQGRIHASGSTDSVISAYFLKTEPPLPSQQNNLDQFRRRRANYAPAKITGIRLAGADEGAEKSQIIPSGSPFTIEIQLVVFEALRAADFCIIFKTAEGEAITAFACSDFTSGLSFDPGHHRVKVTVNDLPLGPGNYLIRVSLDPAIDGDACDLIDNYPIFSVVSSGRIAYWLDRPRVAVQCRAVEWIVSSQNDT